MDNVIVTQFHSRSLEVHFEEEEGKEDDSFQAFVDKYKTRPGPTQVVGQIEVGPPMLKRAASAEQVSADKAASAVELFIKARRGRWAEVMQQLQAEGDGIMLIEDPIVRGGDADVVPPSGWTAPTLARQYSAGSGDTLLHVAARLNAPEEVLAKLVELECDLGWFNNMGRTPADEAEEAGHDAVAAFLQRKIQEKVAEQAAGASSPPSSPIAQGSPRVPSPRSPQGEGKVSICIGDLHGMLHKLERLWAKLPRRLRAEDWATAHVFWLGDYVDKGPDSKGVLEFLTTVSQRHPRQQHHFVMVRSC